MVPLGLLLEWMAKEAAAKTVRSGTVAVSSPAGREAAAAALKDGLRPAAQVAPTRYGRKPYSRGMERDST